MKKHRYLFLFVIPLLIPLIVGGMTKWKEARQHRHYLEQRQLSLDIELWRAADKNDSGKVKQLCIKGANPNFVYTMTGGSTYTTLGCAVNRKNTELIKFLIAQGADVNALHGGGTPLHYAINYRDVLLVRLLLASGADINIKDGSEKTPLESLMHDQRSDWSNPRITPRLKANAQEIERLLRAAATNQQ